jgi:hypothetical protein
MVLSVNRIEWGYVYWHNKDIFVILGKRSIVNKVRWFVMADGEFDERIITGRVRLMKEFLSFLKDKKGGQAGIGFNESSLIYFDSPEPGVLRLRGRPSDGRAPYVKVDVIGLNTMKGKYPPINPSWLYKFVKTGSTEDEFSMIISRDGKVAITFSQSTGQGFNVPIGVSNVEFDIKKFLSHNLFDDEFHIRVPTVRYSVSMMSFKKNIERIKTITDKYFAFYSIDGQLYVYVKDKGESYLENVGITGYYYTLNGKKSNDVQPFDTFMPVSMEYFDKAIRIFDRLDISLPVEPLTIQTFTIDCIKIIEKSAINLTLTSGMNIDFKGYPNIKQMRELVSGKRV